MRGEPPVYDLWVTHRCAIEDLKLETWPDPEGVQAPTHPIVVKFRELRKDEPEPDGHRITSLKDRLCFKLKLERWRGATWYDREDAVLFLLAVGWREAGDADDFYEEVPRLEAADHLYPTEPDYQELERWRANRWLRQIRDETGPLLVATAKEEIEVPRELDLGQCIGIVVAYAINGTFLVLIRLDPPQEGLFLRPDQALLIAQAIVESAGGEVTQTHAWNGQPLPFGSYAFDCIL